MKLKESWKLLRGQIASSSATSIPSGATVLCNKAASPPIVAVIANVYCVVPAKDGFSNDTRLEGVVTPYKEKLCVLSSNLGAVKKELTLEQERRQNVESELSNTKEYVEKLLVEGRKSELMMVELSTKSPESYIFVRDHGSIGQPLIF